MHPLINIVYRPLVEGLKRLTAIRTHRQLDDSEAGHQFRFNSFGKIQEQVAKLDPAKTYAMMVLAVEDTGDGAAKIKVMVEGPQDLIELLSCLHGANMAKDRGDIQELARLAGEVGRTLEAEQSQSMADAGEFINALDPANVARPVMVAFPDIDLTSEAVAGRFKPFYEGECQCAVCKAERGEGPSMDAGAPVGDFAGELRTPTGPEMISDLLRGMGRSGPAIEVVVIDGDLSAESLAAALEKFSPMGKGGRSTH